MNDDCMMKFLRKRINSKEDYIVYSQVYQNPENFQTPNHPAGQIFSINNKNNEDQK